jgi:hypothetical protein
MINLSRTRALLVLVLFVVVTGKPQAQTCRPSDKGAQATLAWARAIATGTDSASQETRSTLKIPATTVSKVVLVTDAYTCAQAVQSLAAVIGASASNRAVYLVKVGTRYVVKDPSVQINGSWLSMVMDSKFVILSRFTG